MKNILRTISLVILIAIILVSPFIAQVSNPQPVKAASSLVQTIIGGGAQYAAGAATQYATLQGYTSWNNTENNEKQRIQVAGVLQNLYIRNSVATTTHTYTVRINGVSTVMSVALTGVSTNSYTSGTLAVAVGDLVSVMLVSTDAAATPYTNWTVEFVPTGSTTNSLIMGLNLCVIAGTRYSGLAHSFYNDADATETNACQVMPTAGTISALGVTMSLRAGAAGDAYTFTLYKNGAPTALTCTLTDPATTGGDLVNSVAVVAGDLVSIGIVPVNVPANAPIAWYGVKFTATNNYECVILSKNSDPQSAAATEYNVVSVSNISNLPAWTGTEANVRQTSGQFTVKNLYISLSGSPDNGAGTQSYTLAIRNTGTTTALSVTISEAATTGSYTATSVDFSRGEFMTMICIPVGTPTVRFARWSFVTYFNPDAIITPTWDQCVQKDYFTTGGDAGGSQIFGATYGAQSFTTLSAYTICYVKISLQRTGTPGTLTLSILGTNAVGDPTGDALAYATFNGDTLGTAAYTWSTFNLLTSTGESLSLEKSKKYVLVLKAVNGSGGNYVQWYADTAAGYAFGNANISTDGGSTWNQFAMAGYDYLFEFWGKASLAVISAKVFMNYKQTGDWLIVIHYFNKTAPHYPNDDVTTYFEIQFLTTTTTVKAANPCQQWGERPGSVYLAAASVIPLQAGDANYNIRLIANYDSSVYSTYVLQPEDWMGQDLDRLDAYCFDIARSIEDNAVAGTVDADLLSDISTRGTVLNNTGSVYFNKGIPGLMSIRPNIFITTTGAEANQGKKGITYYPSWQETLGPYVTGLLNDAGNVAGTDGKDIGFILLMVCYLGVLVSFGTGHMAISIVIGAPFLILALWLGLFGAALIAVGVSILAFLMFRQLFMSR